jgi:hypothetical protein
MRGALLKTAIAAAVVGVSLTAAASLSFSARINSEHALHRGVAVPAGKSVEAEIETTSRTARLQCAFRSPDATRQFAIKQGNPCVVGVSNQGDSRVTLDLVVMTDSRAPIEITGTTTVQTLPSDEDN